MLALFLFSRFFYLGSRMNTTVVSLPLWGRQKEVNGRRLNGVASGAEELRFDRTMPENTEIVYNFGALHVWEGWDESYRKHVYNSQFVVKIKLVLIPDSRVSRRKSGLLFYVSHVSWADGCVSLVDCASTWLGKPPPLVLVLSGAISAHYSFATWPRMAVASI